jgi:hypothetical protein
MMFLAGNGRNVPLVVDENFDRVCSLLNVQYDSPFRYAMELVFEMPSIHKVLGAVGYCREVYNRFGFMHCATSVPLAAIAYSQCEAQMPLPTYPHAIAYLEEKETEEAVVAQHKGFFEYDDEHFLQMVDSAPLDEWNRAFAPTHDADTFYSILAPMVALQYGTALKGKNDVYERYSDVADGLAARWKQE